MESTISSIHLFIVMQGAFMKNLQYFLLLECALLVNTNLAGDQY